MACLPFLKFYQVKLISKCQIYKITIILSFCKHFKVNPFINDRMKNMRQICGIFHLDYYIESSSKRIIMWHNYLQPIRKNIISKKVILNPCIFFYCNIFDLHARDKRQRTIITENHKFTMTSKCVASIPLSSGSS